MDIGTGHLALSSAGALTQRSAQLLEAAQIQLSSGATIANSTDPLNFDATRLTSVAEDSTFLISQNSLLVGTVAEIAVNSINVLGEIGDAVTAAAQSDLTTNDNNGSIILELVAGA